MKRSKPCLPRKMKKAMKGLEIWPEDGRVAYNWRFRVRHYPRTKWVVRAERQFKRIWRVWWPLKTLSNELRSDRH